MGDLSAAVEVSGVSRVFDVSTGPFGAARHVVAVDDVSLSVPAGGSLGIVGESGCGKSTLARIVLGLLPPSSGNVSVDGRALAGMDRRERARLIQPVFQDPTSSLNPRRSVADVVALPLDAAGGVRGAERRRRVDEMLERVGLSPAMATRRPGQLSGGQRQRVAIARALILSPQVLICDEPTSALDVSVQAQILNLLVELRAAMRLTLLFISHNLAVVEHVTDAVAVMYLGRVVERGGTDLVFGAQRHPYTRALLASVLTPEPGLGLPELHLGDGTPDPTNIPPGCRFHTRCPVAIPRCRTEPPARARRWSATWCLPHDVLPHPGVSAMKRRSFLTAAAAAASGAAAGAAFPGGAAAQKAQDTLRVTWRDAVPDVDPYRNSLRTGLVVSQHAWDMLVCRDPETFENVPALATSWTQVDPLTIDFTLREGVTFHNGDPFGADDVVYTINTVIADPKVSVPSNFSFWAGAEKLGDHKVRMKLKAPFPAALEYLAMLTPIYPKMYREKVGPEGYSKAPVGAGPYRITRVNGSSSIEFERFEQYYQGRRSRGRRSDTSKSRRCWTERASCRRSSAGRRTGSGTTTRTSSRT